MITRPIKPVRKREARTPEAYLAKAMDAATPDARLTLAKGGLALPAEDLHVETRMLLLRECYRAHLDLRQLRAARDVALEMSELGPLKDVAHHDVSRVCFALGEVEEALRQQRLAVLAAPEDRRAFHAWGLATLEHFTGDVDGALASLDRAERHATDDRALIRAHRFYVLLDAGREVDLSAIGAALGELRASRKGLGYGQFLAGMIAWKLGQAEEARELLAAFVGRAEKGAAAKRMTLREELRRARVALGDLPPGPGDEG